LNLSQQFTAQVSSS